MKNFLTRLRSFMARRYGTDDLNRFILRNVFVLALIGVLFNSILFKSISILLLVYAISRAMSKKIWDRQKENYQFKEMMKPFNNKMDLIVKNLKDRDHRYFRCEHCGQIVRVPRGKGKIEIKCPRCRKRFDKKS